MKQVEAKSLGSAIMFFKNAQERTKTISMLGVLSSCPRV
jgi:hypothetical protein